jgi:hypothetical protein
MRFYNNLTDKILVARLYASTDQLFHIIAANGTYFGGNASPETTNTHWLGDLTHIWSQAHIHDVYFTGEAIAMRLENRSSDPGSPETGQIWFRDNL